MTHRPAHSKRATPRSEPAMWRPRPRPERVAPDVGPLPTIPEEVRGRRAGPRSTARRADGRAVVDGEVGSCGDILGTPRLRRVRLGCFTKGRGDYEPGNICSVQTQTQTFSGPRRPADAFYHEALLYRGQTEFLAGILPFIREALAGGEPVLVAVTADKIDLLRASLDGHADSVCFADMAVVGRNPTRIISTWRDFLTEHAAKGRRLRAIGEPIWPGRSPAELVECQRHESLINLAFAEAPAWRLLCPYDSDALEPAVLAEARRSHPFIMHGGGQRESEDYRGIDMAAAAVSDPFSEPPGRPPELTFEAGVLDAVRSVVSQYSAAAGLGATGTDDLVLAVNEVATNSVRHGGGQGILRIWQDGDAVICEIRDEGHVSNPLVGRERPTTDRGGGWGLWLANEVCDLVQLRSFSTGTVVRLHMRRR